MEENEKIKILTQGRLSGQNTIKNYLGWERVEEKDRVESWGTESNVKSVEQKPWFYWTICYDI